MTIAPFDDLPSPGQCAPIAVLTLQLLADLRQWTKAVELHDTPIEAMAIAAANISPCRGAAELRLTTRMYAWTYALDNHVERDITDLATLDELIRQCGGIVRNGRYDGDHPLLTALAEWQRELNRQPLYPPLSDLWVNKVDLALRATRYDWTAGRARHDGHGSTDVREYLDHADSVLVWMANFARWTAYLDLDLLDRLDVLVPAMDDIAVTIRLANDLATYSWEQDEYGQNNILMYGVTPDWVRTEIRNSADSARRRLTALTAAGYLPAIELVRQLDWALSFYALADFRGWGSDSPSDERRTDQTKEWVSRQPRHEEGL